MPSKAKTNIERRRERVAIGLPRYTAAEAAGRRAANLRRRERHTKENFEFVAALKMRLGCTDCGYKGHPAALDFDHLPGFEKREIIARMIGWPRSTLLAELAKCEVVCANCHRIRTWKRKQASLLGKPVQQSLFGAD